MQVQAWSRAENGGHGSDSWQKLEAAQDKVYITRDQTATEHHPPIETKQQIDARIHL